VRFVHTADWQLGHDRHFLNARRSPGSAARREWSRTRSLVAENGSEFVVVAGRLSSTTSWHHARSASRSRPCVRSGSGCICFPATAIRWTRHPSTPVPSFSRVPRNVTVLDRSGPHEVRPGVQIVAAHGVQEADDEWWARLSAAIARRRRHAILVGHGGSTIWTRSEKLRDPLSVMESALTRGAVHYVHGDKHSRTQVASRGRVLVLRPLPRYEFRPHRGRFRARAVVDIDEDDPARAVRVDRAPCTGDGAS